MNITLVTTTINVPEVLRRYREIGPDVHFIVVGDRKTPHAALLDLSLELGNCEYLSPALQTEAHWRLSQAIGWDKIQRRNIGIIEAAQRGADVILSIDDDNAPLSETYFEDLRRAFSSPHKGWVAKGEWCNIGELAHDKFRYRGFPVDVEPELVYEKGECELGAVNGLIFGDPDIDATYRRELAPNVTRYAFDVLEGIAVSGGTWSPINSQNTAWRAELAPLAFVLPGVGRYDDIWGSYLAQRVMGELEYGALFGKPYVWQDRNEQSVVRNLRDEVYGLEHTPEMVSALRSATLTQRKPLALLEELVAALTGLSFSLPWKFLDEWIQAWRRIGWR